MDLLGELHYDTYCDIISITNKKPDKSKAISINTNGQKPNVLFNAPVSFNAPISLTPNLNAGYTNYHINDCFSFTKSIQGSMGYTGVFENVVFIKFGLIVAIFLPRNTFIASATNLIKFDNCIPIEFKPSLSTTIIISGIRTITTAEYCFFHFEFESNGDIVVKQKNERTGNTNVDFEIGKAYTIEAFTAFYFK